MCELFLPFTEQCFVLNINLNLLRLQALSYQHGTKTKIQARLLYTQEIAKASQRLLVPSTLHWWAESTIDRLRTVSLGQELAGTKT